MEAITVLLAISQLVFVCIAGIYFYQNIKSQSGGKTTVSLESKKEMERLRFLRTVSLTKPLSEKTRPTSLDEVVGQKDGIKALRAALCGPNPQHVIIYGPPGVGKTAAARLILEEAKRDPKSPFQQYAKFVEIDATTLRFDERSIADPLLGSVHDPIYQGAGAYGPAGIPQPKEGAVTKAHGGILFIDEIGELHPIQLNKLLKVLEDRAVFLTSSYYSSENPNIPRYIHDIFKNGLPADFRLVGATTRRPEELPPALRSRCREIFFDGLKKEHIKFIAFNAAAKAGFSCEETVMEEIADFASNGRDSVNMVQTAASVALLEKRNIIKLEDLEWVIASGRYHKKLVEKVGTGAQVGVVNGLAVYGYDAGALMKIEAKIFPAKQKGQGSLQVTGIADREDIKEHNHVLSRKSTARGSVENVLTVLETITEKNLADYHVHINFPGGMIVDGPSAGIAIFCALYSALFQKPVTSKIAMTGELSIQGDILPVGGVTKKIEAAIEAGATTIVIPKENDMAVYRKMQAKVISVAHIQEVLKLIFHNLEDNQMQDGVSLEKKQGVLTAKSY